MRLARLFLGSGLIRGASFFWALASSAGMKAPTALVAVLAYTFHGPKTASSSRLRLRNRCQASPTSALRRIRFLASTLIFRAFCISSMARSNWPRLRSIRNSALVNISVQYMYVLAFSRDSFSRSYSSLRRNCSWSFSSLSIFPRNSA